MDRAARLNRRSQPSGEEGAEAVVTMPAWNPENEREAKSGGVRTSTVLIITVSGGTKGRRWDQTLMAALASEQVRDLPVASYYVVELASYIVARGVLLAKILNRNAQRTNF